MNERTIYGHITELLAEERGLRARHVGEGLSAAERTRLQTIEVDLDQCWDLLRQRRAKAEFGENPDQAAARPAGEVESYLQ
jgi:hypothetical protein